jgi:D-3-phosphoglycerate dehydrogenase
MARVVAVRSISWTDAGWAEAMRLLEQAGHEVGEWDSLAGDQARAALREAHGLFVEITPVPAALIESAPYLVAIGKGGVGLDSIDLAAAAAAGIAVYNTPGSNSECVADHTFALLLALTRRLIRLDGATRAGRGWEPWPPAIGEELTGKTIGVIGAGNSGRAVIRRAKAFGLHVLAYDPVPAALDNKLDVEATSLADLLARADVVTLHVPLTPETTGLIAAPQLAAMRAGAYLINVSRGGIVDEDALLAALESGRLAGAGIDVFAAEPATASPLFGNDHVIVTPHSAGISAGSIARSRIETARNLVGALGGSPSAAPGPGHLGEEADRLRLRAVDLGYVPAAIVPATALRWIEGGGR